MMSDMPSKDPGPDSAVPTAQDKLVAEALLKESDRGCAILAASLIAEALERLLRAFGRHSKSDVKKHIDPLFRGYAPLATLSGRAQVAFALGLLPRQTLEEITFVRKMRNAFAHEWGPIDFRDPRFAERMGANRPVPDEDQDMSIDDVAKRAVWKEQLVTRLTFQLFVTEIVGRIKFLTDRAHEGVDIRVLVVRLEESDESQRGEEKQRGLAKK